jgi:hypothetical protein
MAFVVPQFPLAVAIWTGPGHAGAPRLTTVGNLAPGRRILMQWWDWTTVGSPAINITLLVPALTDIRGWNDPVSADVVEVPQGSGRFYIVDQVDDYGKGFANEHRFAILEQTTPWPQPIP